MRLRTLLLCLATSAVLACQLPVKPTGPDTVPAPAPADARPGALATPPTPPAQQQEQLLSDWATDLRDGDYRTRYGARLALAESGAAAIPYIAPVLDDPDPELRENAAWAMSGVKADLPQALFPAFLRLAQARNPHVRNVGVVLLGRLKGGARQAAPLVRGEIKDQDRAVRASATLAFGRIEGPQAVPALMGLLSDGELAPSAAVALGEIGPPAAAALPALEQMTRQGDEQERREAANAVAKIRGKGR
jgi:HEAT repeat protein